MSSFFQTYIAAKVIREHRIMCIHCSHFFWVISRKSAQRYRCPKCGKSFELTLK